jgi:hypothetical protein
MNQILYLKNKNMHQGKKGRQTGALNRLQNQLKAGTKTEKVSALTKATTGANQVELTDSDVKRINKEIEVLKTRV